MGTIAKYPDAEKVPLWVETARGCVLTMEEHLLANTKVVPLLHSLVPTAASVMVEANAALEREIVLAQKEALHRLGLAYA